MKYLILTLISLLYFNFGYSQIKVKEVNFVGDTIQKKPKIYDGISNFVYQRNIIDYNQYVGYDIFIPYNQTLMCTKASKINHDNIEITTYLYNPIIDKQISPFGKLTCNQNLIKNKTYKILDINFKNDTVFNDLSKKEYSNYYNDINFIHVENYFTEDKDNYDGGTVLFKLLDKTTNEIVYTSFYLSEENDIYKNFIFVPYFEEIKKTYNNKQLILYEVGYNKDGPSFYFSDMYTGKKIPNTVKSKWTCNVEIINRTDPQNDQFIAYKICYVLKNQLGQSVIFDELKNDRYTFMLIEDYNTLLQKKISLVQQEKIKAQNQKKKELELFNKKKEILTSKFGQTNGTLICNNQVKLNMSKEMCKLSWGEPIDIKQNINSDGDFEFWYYGSDMSLKFKNGLLYEIQK